MVSRWLRRPVFRRALFAAVVILLVSTVAWLGWSLLAQDEQLAAQRLTDDREAAADLVVAAFDQRLSRIDRELETALMSGVVRYPRAEMTGAAILTTSGGVIDVWPEHRLRYYPEPQPRPSVIEADQLVERAQASFKAGRFADALALYDRLDDLGAVRIGDVVGGIPAPLFADLGRIAVYQRQANQQEAVKTARRLSDSIQAGRWPVSAATYQFLDEQAQGVLGGKRERDPQLVLAEAVAWLWSQRASGSVFPASGRVTRMFDSGAALVIWRSSATGFAAFVAGQDALEAVWFPAVAPLTKPRRATVSVATVDGQPIAGTISAGDRAAMRLATAALPLTVQITNTADDAALRERRRMLLAAMVVFVLLVVCGAWVIERTVARELAVADLQSDFVSAVSHEFRTPLTTLCQLTEMLTRDRVASDEDRRQYYQLLHGESHRLRRLVETLLNFGRLEAGRMEFHFTDVAVSALVRSTIEDFSASKQARQHRIELQGGDLSLSTRADGDVLRTVLWNLLENAAKYSPGCDTIWVAVGRQGNRVTLSVTDRGVGIPRGEQRRVFEKFVRGSEARASGVGGVGVGLAMARRIVDAHGGEIRLESRPGAGSTFTVVLPLVAAPVARANSQAVTAG